MLDTRFDPETRLLTVTARGEIGHEDYVERLIPAVEAAVGAGGKINLLYVFPEGYEGFSSRAMWDDTRLGMTHLGDFRRCAVASDSALIRNLVSAFGVLIPAEVRSFPLDELAAARAWCSDAS